MQRRTLGTREALEGILEDAATPTRAFASDYGYDLVSLLLPGDECSYVMGNPPFIGHQQHTQQIKDDMELVCGKAGGSLDYVAGWYFKAIDFLDGNPSAQFAFVSTNSITQGQHKSPRYSSMCRTRVAYPVRSPYVLLGRSDYGQCERACRHCRIRQRRKRSCVV